MPVGNILLSIIASVVYSLSVYLKRRPTDKAEPLEWNKLGATLVVGAIIGLVAGGIVPSEVSVEAQLGMYAGFIVLVENAIKTVYRYIVKYTPL